MNYFIEVYIFICVTLLVFDIVFLLVKNIRKDVLYVPNHYLQSLLEKQILLHRDTGSFSPDFHSRLYHSLSNTKNLLTLQTVLERYPDSRDWFRHVVLSRVDTYLKKPEHERAYYAYLVSTFDYQQEPVPPAFVQEFLLFLDSNSLYTFANAMSAVYQFGEEHILVQAIDKVDARSGFYHKKLFVDGLLSSPTDRQALCTSLQARFYQYTPHTQDCLVDFFRMCGFDASSLCMELLCSPRCDLQVRYTAMRYFAKYPCSDSRRHFLDILSHDQSDWLLSMLALQGLARYQDEEVIAALYSKITSRHWFVRLNAVDLLCRHGLTLEDVSRIIDLRDRFTNETLLYQYRDDPEMTQFIRQRIELFSPSPSLTPPYTKTPAVV